MALPTNTATTYDFGTKHLREDLSDTIYLVSNKQTPFMNAVAKTKATSRTHDWVTDSLRAVAANKHLEGDNTTAEAYTPPTRNSNHTQIFKVSKGLSETSVAVDVVGAQNEYDRVKINAQLELMRDAEATFVGNQAPNAGAAGTARALRPLMGWFSSNVSRAGDGADGTTSAAATDGTKRDFAKSMLDDVLQSIYSNTGMSPNYVMVNPKQKRNLDTMAIANVTRQESVNGGKVAATINVYENSFGNDLTIMLNPHMRDREMAVINTDYFGIAELRPASMKELPVSGDSRQFEIVMEATLECRNEAASGVVADLN